MTHAPVRFRQRLTRNAALASGVLLRVAAGVLPAHEGHTPLPSEGGAVAVAKGFIRLSRKQSWAVLLGVFLLLW